MTPVADNKPRQSESAAVSRLRLKVSEKRGADWQKGKDVGGSYSKRASLTGLCFYCVAHKRCVLQQTSQAASQADPLA